MINNHHGSGGRQRTSKDGASQVRYVPAMTADSRQPNILRGFRTKRPAVRRMELVTARSLLVRYASLSRSLSACLVRFAAELSRI